MRPFTPFLCLAAIAVILFGRGALSAPLPSPVATGHSHRAKRMDGIDKVTHWLAENDGNHLEALERLLDRTSTPETTDLHISEPSTPTQQWASSSGVSAQPALGSYDTRGYTSAQHLQPGGNPNYAGPSVPAQPHGYGIYHHDAHWHFPGDTLDLNQPAPEQYERGTTGMESDEPAHEQALVHDQGSVEHLVPPGADPVAILSRTDLTSQQAAALIDNICQHYGAKDGLMRAGEALMSNDRLRKILSAMQSTQVTKIYSFVYADDALIVWLRKVYQLRLAKVNNAVSYRISFEVDDSKTNTIQRRFFVARGKKHGLVDSTGSSLDISGSGLDSFENDDPFEAFKVGDYWIRGTARGGGTISAMTPFTGMWVSAYKLHDTDSTSITFGLMRVRAILQQ